MADPAGYLLTWTTYGSWLPGDDRGWVDRRHPTGDLVEKPRPGLMKHAKDLLTETVVILDEAMRTATEQAIRRCCSEEQWWLHALEVRSNHVHVVVTARGVDPGRVMGRLKARATQALNEAYGRRQHWWTQQGSKRILNSQVNVDAAVRYVHSQDVSWKKHL